MNSKAQPSKPLKSKLPCKLCPSSDAVTRYQRPNGSIFEKCFSCSGVRWLSKFQDEPDIQEEELLSQSPYSSQGTELNTHKIIDNFRGILPATFEFFGVTFDDNFNYVFPYASYEAKLLAQKIKFTDPNSEEKYRVHHLVTKGFQQSGLFGAWLFPTGSRYLTITEGELDALSAFQIQGSKYPTVSLKNGVNSVLTDDDKKFLDKFENIILCFDSDDKGRAAAKKFASSFPKNKVKIVTLAKGKDANEYLQNGLFDDFIFEWWKAKEYTPEGLVQGNATWDILESETNKKGIPWPWQGIQHKLYDIQTSRIYLLTSGSGVGKCFAEGTEVLMFDGTKKKVQNVKVGDKVLSPDGIIRNVLSLHSGEDKLYDITPVKGNKYQVNKHHTLCLWDTKTKEYKELSVKQYNNLTPCLQKRLKGYSSNSLEFPTEKKELPLDPYWFGLWLGDGRSNSMEICSYDKEIIEYIEQYANELDMQFSCYENGKGHNDSYSIVKPVKNSKIPNPVLQSLRKLNVLNNKHIPYEYRTASVKNRLKLLAGLIDTDGNVSNNCFEISQKNKRLAEDIVYLSKSLGYATSMVESRKKDQNGTEGIYWRIIISGHTNLVPTLLSRKQCTERLQVKNPIHTGITVKFSGKVGKYYGFKTDGDHKFLLGDFTVVHNSEVVKEIALHIAHHDSESRIGGLFLEESIRETVKILTGMQLSLNLRIPDNVVTQEDKKRAWANLFDNDRWVFWDHFGSNDIESVCNQVRFIANNFGAKYIFLDHISIVVSAQDNGDERKALDEIMTKLRMITQELDIALFLVSHLRRPDGRPHEEGGVTSLAQLRGSAAIGQLADVVIGLERNGQADNEVERNITTLRLLKNRITGETGPCAYLQWVRDTGRLSELDGIAGVQEKIEATKGLNSKPIVNLKSDTNV